jgi:O-antigen/teichoic acid export membrane protein
MLKKQKMPTTLVNDVCSSEELARSGNPQTCPPPLQSSVDLREFRALYKRTSHFFAGTICLFLLGFVSFPILARIFDVEQYGLIALVSSVVAVAVVFSKFGLQTSVQRFYKENTVSPGDSFQRFYSTVFLSAAGMGLTVTAGFLVGLWALPRNLIDPQIRLLLLYAAALIFVRTITSMITNLLQVEGRTVAYNLLQVLTKAATIGVTLLLLLGWRRTPAVFFGGLVMVEAGAVLTMVPNLRRRGMLAVGMFDRHIFREVMHFGLPMMGVEIFWMLLDSGNRLLVELYLGAKQLGYFAAAYNISGYARDWFSTPLYLALFPMVMEMWVLKGREMTVGFLSRSLHYYVLAGIGIVSAISACSGDAINLVASPKYHAAHVLLPYLVIGMLVSSASMFFKSVLMIDKKVFLMMRINLYACLANLLLDILLLPRIGILGAAIATLVSFILMTVILAWHSQRHLALELRWVAWARFAAVGYLTAYVVSKVSLSNLLLSLAVRGSLSVILYVGTLCLLDPQVRDLIVVSVRSGTSLLCRYLVKSPAAST